MLELKGYRLRWGRAWLHPERRLSRKSWALLLAGAALLIILVSMWNILEPTLFPLPEPSSRLTSVSGQGSLGEPPVGTLVWTVDMGDPLFVSPVVSGDMVYIVAGDSTGTGRVEALELATGSPAWEVLLDGLASGPPIVAGDLLFVSTRDGRLLALDSGNGDQRWSFDAGSQILGSPVVDEGVVYFASSAVYALDAQTGEKRWRQEIGRGGSGAAVSDGVVVAVGTEGDDINVFLLDAASGKHRFSFHFTFVPSRPPVIVGDTVAMTGDGRGGTVHTVAVDLPTTEIPFQKAIYWWRTRLWWWDLAPQPPPPKGFLWQWRATRGLTGHTLASDSNHIYVAAKPVASPGGPGRVTALDPLTGNVVWEFLTETSAASSGVVFGDTLVFGTQGGRVYGVDAESGVKLWEVEVDGPVGGAPAAAGGLLLVASLDGNLYAIR